MNDEDLRIFIRNIIDLIKIKQEYIDMVETMTIKQLKTIIYVYIEVMNNLIDLIEKIL